MNEQNCDLGLVGLGTMGRNFLLNIADKGFAVAGYDKDTSRVNTLPEGTGATNIHGARSVKEFINALNMPRTVLMLVPAGDVVDVVVNDLAPHLDKGDLIIDGGNSHFTDTNRRQQGWTEKGIHFLGLGISGGAEGALRGPSLMPGGPEEAYETVKELLEATAARVNGEPCVTYLGPGSAGHYVKMVHNGIEYGLMQLISETYDIMKRGLGMHNEELHNVYEDWNRGELQSFLVEITAEIFKQPDEQTGKRLIDMILDESKQKGTGKWASQDAMNLRAPLPTVDIAVAMRDMSAYKEERKAAASIISGPGHAIPADKKSVIQQLKNALYFSFIITYAQGMDHLKAASAAYNYNLNLGEVARIWRGGCIIRAGILEDIRKAYNRKEVPANLLVDPRLSGQLVEKQKDIREVVRTAAASGIPVPGMMISLAYFDAYRSNRLPANLIQAQRDFFGSHTYERIDREGAFHTNWSKQA